MKVRKIAEITQTVAPIWDESLKECDLKGKNLHYLIGIKKSLFEESNKIQETMVEKGKTFGGEWSKDGQFTIPKEHVADMNKWLAEFNDQEINVNLNPLILSDDEFLPPILMEAFYDYVSFSE